MPPLLVTFAVAEEARPFQRRCGQTQGLHVLLTGIGARQARITASRALVDFRPTGVLSCGFAGGLHPELHLGDVLLDSTQAGSIAPSLAQLRGIRTASFHTCDHVVSTAAEKQQLRQATGADAVDMESGAIREVCRQHGIPCAVLRVVSDEAGQDLPLDFNRMLDPSGRVALAPLLGAIAANPRLIPALLRFQRETRRAAEALAEVLLCAVHLLQQSRQSASDKRRLD